MEYESTPLTKLGTCTVCNTIYAYAISCKQVVNLGSNAQYTLHTLHTISSPQTLAYMDSLLVSSVFRMLFHHRALRLCRTTTPLLARPHPHSRPFATSSSPGGGRGGHQPKERQVVWQPRSIHMYQDVSEEFGQYPMVTAADLAGRGERPRRVKMWARDFIDGL